MVLRVLDLSPCGGVRYICGMEDDSAGRMDMIMVIKELSNEDARI